MFFKKKEVKEEESKNILFERVQSLSEKLSKLGTCEHTGFVADISYDVRVGVITNKVQLFTNLGWRKFTIRRDHLIDFSMYEVKDVNSYNYQEFKEGLLAQNTKEIFSIQFIPISNEDGNPIDAITTITPMLGVKLSAKDIDLAILELERTVEMYYSHHKNMLEIHNKEVEKLQKGEINATKRAD